MLYKGKYGHSLSAGSPELKKRVNAPKRPLLLCVMVFTACGGPAIYASTFVSKPSPFPTASPAVLLHVWQPVLLCDLDDVRSDHNRRSIKASLALTTVLTSISKQAEGEHEPILKSPCRNTRLNTFLSLIASWVWGSLWIFHAKFIKYTSNQNLSLFFPKGLPSADNSKKPQKRSDKVTKGDICLQL